MKYGAGAQSQAAGPSGGQQLRHHNSHGGQQVGPPSISGSILAGQQLLAAAKLEAAVTKCRPRASWQHKQEGQHRGQAAGACAPMPRKPFSQMGVSSSRISPYFLYRPLDTL